RSAFRAGGKRLLPQDQIEIVSAGPTRSGAVDLYGPPGETAAIAGMGIRDRSRRSDLHLQAPAGVQLAAGHGGRDRFQPCLLPASRTLALRPAAQWRHWQAV